MKKLSPGIVCKLLMLLLVVSFITVAPRLVAQTAPQVTAPPTPAPDQTQDQGGPATDNGPMVIPKKKEPSDNTPPPAPAQPKVKNPNGETYSLRVDVPIVTLDVNVILDKNHQFVPGLKAQNF